jgi:hypothetical protein
MMEFNMASVSPLRLAVAAVAGGIVVLGFVAAAGALGGPPAASPTSAAPQTSAAPADVQVQAPTPPAAQTASAQTFAGAGYLPSPEALASLGIVNPIEIEREHGRIEIVHLDAQGRRVETYLDAATGAVVKQEIDDRFGESSRGRNDD